MESVDTPRTRLLDKIRALLAKTTAAGCTEEEELSALAKARAMMDAYEVSDEELALTKDEKAILHPSNSERGKHDISGWFNGAIERFTGTRCWVDRNGKWTWCGLRADAEFADWLSDHLTQFVRGELVNYLVANTAIPPKEKRRHINGFVIGIGERISQRLDELRQSIASPQHTPSATQNALTLANIKKDAIKACMLEHDIRVRLAGGGRVTNAGARAAGSAAGGRASFGRPVGSGSLRLGRG
jgi:hypothetical protein